MTQQARDLLMDLDDRSRRPRFLIHDRDTNFSRAFASNFRSEGVEIVRTPIQATKANAYAEPGSAACAGRRRVRKFDHGRFAGKSWLPASWSPRTLRNVGRTALAEHDPGRIRVARATAPQGSRSRPASTAPRPHRRLNALCATR
jgi:hypothetical protein